MSNESPIAELTRVLREVGVIDRMAELNINENYNYLYSVGDLPELLRGKKREKLVPGPDTTGSNVAGISARQNVDLVPESSLPTHQPVIPVIAPDPTGNAASPISEFGSLGTLSGTLTVDKGPLPVDGQPPHDRTISESTDFSATQQAREEAERDTHTHTLTDADLEAIDEASTAEDETSTTVTKKRGKKH